MAGYLRCQARKRKNKSIVRWWSRKIRKVLQFEAWSLKVHGDTYLWERGVRLGERNGQTLKGDVFRNIPIKIRICLYGRYMRWQTREKKNRSIVWWWSRKIRKVLQFEAFFEGSWWQLEMNSRVGKFMHQFQMRLLLVSHIVGRQFEITNLQPSFSPLSTLCPLRSLRSSVLSVYHRFPRLINARRSFG